MAKYYRVATTTKDLDNIIIITYPDYFNTQEVAKNLRNEIKEITKEEYPSFAFEEISEKQMLKEKIKGVTVI